MNYKQQEQTKLTYGHSHTSSGVYRELLLGTAFSGPQQWLYGDWKVESGTCFVKSGNVVIDLDKIESLYPGYSTSNGYGLAEWFMQCQKKFEAKLLDDKHQWIYLYDGSYPPDPPELYYDFASSTISILDDDSIPRSLIYVDKMCKVLSGLDRSVKYHVERFIDNTNDRNDVYYTVIKTPEDECSKIHAMVFNNMGGPAMNAYYLFAECDVDTKSEADEFFRACIPKAVFTVCK